MNISGYEYSSDQYARAEARLLVCIRACFSNPLQALRRIETYRKKAGNERLYRMLAETAETTFFGRFVGAPFALGPIAAKSHESYRKCRIARQILPEVVRQFDVADARQMGFAPAKQQLDRSMGMMPLVAIAVRAFVPPVRRARPPRWPVASSVAERLASIATAMIAMFLTWVRRDLALARPTRTR